MAIVSRTTARAPIPPTNTQSVPATRMLSNAISAAAMPAPSAARPRQSSRRTASGGPRISLSATENRRCRSGC